MKTRWQVLRLMLPTMPVASSLAICQSALNIDPLSASNFDPFYCRM